VIEGFALVAQLAAWAATYGGEQYARLGYSELEALAEAPANDADYGIATAIERVVQEMTRSGRWKEARVLRAEYFLAGLTEVARLRALKRKGCDVSRAAYYVYLASAQAYVAGALKTVARPAPSPLAEGISAWLGDRRSVTSREVIVGLQLGSDEDRGLQAQVCEAMRELGWRKFRPRYRAGEPRRHAWTCD
jgi:hypothetical protein